MAVQLSTYSEPLEGPSRMGKNMNTSSLSMSAPFIFYASITPDNCTLPRNRIQIRQKPPRRLSGGLSFEIAPKGARSAGEVLRSPRARCAYAPACVHGEWPQPSRGHGARTAFRTNGGVSSHGKSLRAAFSFSAPSGLDLHCYHER